MQVLNLDAFVTPQRFLELKGMRYAVKELNVQQFIDNLAAAEALEAKAKAKGGASRSEPTMSEQIKTSLAQIRDAIPDLPETELKMLPVEAIVLVLQLIRGELDQGQPTDTAEGDAEKKST